MTRALLDFRFVCDDRRARRRLEHLARTDEQADEIIETEARASLRRIRGFWPRASGRSARAWRLRRRAFLRWLMSNPDPKVPHVRRSRKKGEPPVLRAEVLPELQAMRNRAISKLRAYVAANEGVAA